MNSVFFNDPLLRRCGPEMGSPLDGKYEQLSKGSPNTGGRISGHGSEAPQGHKSRLPELATPLTRKYESGHIHHQFMDQTVSQNVYRDICHSYSAEGAPQAAQDWGFPTAYLTGQKYNHLPRYTAPGLDSGRLTTDSSFASEYDPQPFPPTAVSTTLYTSSGSRLFWAQSSQDGDSFRSIKSPFSSVLLPHHLDEHFAYVHEEDRSPQTGSHSPKYDPTGRLHSSCSAVTKKPASLTRTVIASPGVRAASTARRAPGKQASYHCPHCSDTFTSSHNLQNMAQVTFALTSENVHSNVYDASAASAQRVTVKGM
ncbi:hypothetical protein VNI00_018814 [Paramarasmius palmivorus]|uniref:Uncharacterized protein n=1 Tax=Paramarasmius palmivorus TaxID=297713 RepID=A0AAW0AU29_9AGAR